MSPKGLRSIELDPVDGRQLVLSWITRSSTMNRSTALTVRTTVFPETPYVVKAPVGRNASVNHSAHAAAFGLWIVSVIPLYQFSHWLSRHETKKTWSFTALPSQDCMLPSVTCWFVAVTAAESWDCALSTLNFASESFPALAFTSLQLRRACACFSGWRTADTAPGVAAPWPPQYWTYADVLPTDEACSPRSGRMIVCS